LDSDSDPQHCLTGRSIRKNVYIYNVKMWNILSV